MKNIRIETDSFGKLEVSNEKYLFDVYIYDFGLDGRAGDGYWDDLQGDGEFQVGESLNPILGEDELALTSILSYLLEDTNFVIKAYSGTGKTVIMDAIFGLLPDEFYFTMEHLSETAVWYEMDKINRARFVAIPEAQKLPEPVMEVVKTWGDGRAAQRKRTDVTIKETVSQINMKTDYPMVLMITTSQYPTPNEDVNILKLQSIRNEFPNIIIGYYFFSDFPDNWTFLGLFIIVLSGIYISRRENLSKKFK